MAPKAAKSQPQQKKTTATTTKTADAPSKKARAPKIEWNKHPEWTTSAIEYLTNEPTFRLKLFGDSTTEAKDEGRKKVQAHEGKTILYGMLAKEVFENVDDIKVRAEYAANPTAFGSSTQQQFARYVYRFNRQTYRTQATPD